MAERPWQARHHRTRRVVDSTDGVAVVLDQASPFPTAAGRWLAQLCLLEGIPFDHLVPDARMLPPESIRFFFVDQNWLDALVDGALSIGAVAEHEATMVAAARDHLGDLARRHTAVERGRRRAAHLATSPRARATASDANGGTNEPDVDTTAPVWSGFLLRSALVTDWPGLRVTATDAGGGGLQLLRLDRPAPAVLVAIFDGIVGRVDLATPAQTLHFGAVDDAGTLRVGLRGLGGRFAVGEQIKPQRWQEVPMRDDGDRRVVDVRALVAGLTTQLASAYAPDAAPPVHPGAFGVELVAAAERQSFAHVAVLRAPAVTDADADPSAPAPAPAPVTVAGLRQGLDRG